MNKNELPQVDAKIRQTDFMDSLKPEGLTNSQLMALCRIGIFVFVVLLVVILVLSFLYLYYDNQKKYDLSISLVHKDGSISSAIETSFLDEKMNDFYVKSFLFEYLSVKYDYELYNEYKLNQAFFEKKANFLRFYGDTDKSFLEAMEISFKNFGIASVQLRPKEISYELNDYLVLDNPEEEEKRLAKPPELMHAIVKITADVFYRLQKETETRVFERDIYVDFRYLQKNPMRVKKDIIEYSKINPLFIDIISVSRGVDVSLLDDNKPFIF